MTLGLETKNVFFVFFLSLVFFVFFFVFGFLSFFQ